MRERIPDNSQSPDILNLGNDHATGSNMSNSPSSNQKNGCVDC